MADGVWRSFRFFDGAPLPPSSGLPDLNVVSACLSPTSLVIGDYEGQVLFLDRHPPGVVLWRFQAYAGAVTHLRYCAARNTLLTIGDDDALNTAIVRVWDLDQLVGLYRGLLDNYATAGGSGASAGPRWRPPCQEYRLLSPATTKAAAALVEEAPLVPIILQESKQLQCTFRPSASTASTTASLTPGSPVQTAAEEASTAAVSCGSIRSAVVCFDVAPDLTWAAAGLANRDCVVLRGDLAKEHGVRTQTIRSAVAKGALTYVALPSTAHATFMESSRGTVSGGEVSGFVEVRGLFGGGLRSTTTDRGWNSSSINPVSAASAVGQPVAPPLPARVQLLYTVYEDVVTCWALRANGSCSEYPCPTTGGAPRHGAALTTRGELLLLGKQTLTHAAGSRVTRIGPPSVAHAPSRSAIPQIATTTALYDPTLKASVHTTDIDHAPGHCFLYTYRDYLALLVQQEGRPEQYQLQCYDLTYRIRGLSRQQENYVNCATVLADDTDLLVLFQDPASRTRQLSLRGTCLHEVNTHAKLELLFSKECYGIAQQLAETMEGTDAALQVRIRKRYGDYLYNKGKLSDAMEQYLATIGHLESSYVIRRYMGSAHMTELVRYLEELHLQKYMAYANEAHTTLLLKCYSKLKDEARLRVFIHRDDIRFDPENAAAVCRDGGYPQAALYIADRYARVYDCARIRLYDLHEPLATLAYLRTLGVDEAEQIAVQLGKDLLSSAPRATTELLIELCVYWKGPGRRLVDSVAIPSTTAEAGMVVSAPHQTPPPVGAMSLGSGGLRGPRHTHHANASAFLHVFVDAPVCLMHFLRAVVESGVLGEGEEEEVVAETATAKKPTPGDPFSSSRPPKMEEETEIPAAMHVHAALYNTLLELYMTRDLRSTLQLVPKHRRPSPGEGTTNSATAPSVTGSRALTPPSRENSGSATFPDEPYERRLEQARTFLEAYRGRYDHYLALSLAHQHHFQDGILYLLRMLGHSEEILRYYRAKLTDPRTTTAERREATERLFEACQASAPSDSGTTAMWMTLLSQLMRTPRTEWQDIVKVLDYIEAHDALSPVVVLEILSSNPQGTLTLRTVRDYCQRCLQKQTNQVREVLAQTAQHMMELEKVKQSVTTLQTTAVVFQSTACAHCHQVLDAPSVYFMCKHAFHSRCLYAPTECNICGPGHRRQLDVIRHAEQRELQRQNPSTFTAQYFDDVKRGGKREGTEKAPAAATAASPRDGFAVVTDYVARGVLGAPPLYKDASLFGFDTAVPLRASADGRQGAEDAVDMEDLEVW